MHMELISKWRVCKRGDRLRRGAPLNMEVMFWWGYYLSFILHASFNYNIYVDTSFMLKKVLLFQQFSPISFRWIHISLQSVAREIRSPVCLIYEQQWPSLGCGAPLVIIIWNMRTGGAARCIRVFCSTTIVKLGCIGRVIRSQLVVPWICDIQIFVNNKVYSITICKVTHSKQIHDQEKKRMHRSSTCLSNVMFCVVKLEQKK